MRVHSPRGGGAFHAVGGVRQVAPRSEGWRYLPATGAYRTILGTCNINSSCLTITEYWKVPMD